MGFLYFKTCCTYPNDNDNYFGIDFVPTELLIVDMTYKIITETQTICGIYYEGVVPGTISIYSDVVDVIYYGTNCYDCLLENPCEPPTPTPLPPQPQPINECNVITIFPMEIKCVVSNPTSPISSDGEMSVSITGGTPPYTVIWSNGNISPAIQNLTVGEYSATVIDYYGDFSATTTCELTSEYDCEFSANTEYYSTELNPIPNGEVMSQNYLVTITGGTSPGPYTIYYDTINKENIALKYLYYTPATDITLSELISGYYATVPNETKQLYLYNQLCETNQSFPIENPQQTYDFCIIIDGDFAIHFNPNGLYDGYQSWISDDTNYLTIFDTSINKWKVSGGTLPFQIVSNASYPPLTGWYTIGGGAGNLLSNEGNCLTTTPLEFSVITNNPTCECDGSIIFQPYGGTPPYQYSIDNGVTQSSSAIFNNLCGGNYTLVLTDSNSNTYYDSVILTNTQLSITYSVSITPVVTTISDTPTLKTNQITATINVTPPLPSGVLLTLKLNHSNVFSSSPAPTTSTLTTNTTLTKNGIPQTPPLNTIGTSISQNTIPACQNTIVYNQTINDFWNSITMNSGDVIALNTTTTISKTIVKCLVGTSLDTYNITAASISGCDCCNVEIININSGSSGEFGGSSIGGIIT